MTLSRRHFLGLAGAALMIAPGRAASGMAAYNIETLHRSIGAGDARGDGWIFGMPPGIGAAQWPLDRNNGYPLQHGFTLLLPEDYRVHGPELVALSFFSTAFDHNDGVPMVSPDVRALLGQDDPARPDDPHLLPFWEARQSEHQRLYRMRDVLDLDYAAILLTEAEFNGAFAVPPDLRGNPHLDKVAPPGWLVSGGGKSYWDQNYFTGGDLPAEDYFIYRQLGGVPEQGSGFNRALRITPRRNDPNAGIAPQDRWLGEQTDYQQPYYEIEEDGETRFRRHKWTKGHASNHIGGTMRPAQAVPEFSPYYIEFEESFGGYNFGGGNAQLDFKDMRFDWAQ